MSCSFQTQSAAVLSLTLKLWKGGKILKARTGKDLRKVAAISRLKSPWQQWPQKLFLRRWTYQDLWVMMPRDSWHAKSAETGRDWRQSRVKNRPERCGRQMVYRGQCYLVVSTATWSREMGKKIGTERPLRLQPLGFRWGSWHARGPDTSRTVAEEKCSFKKQLQRAEGEFSQQLTNTGKLQHYKKWVVGNWA